ncbi:arginase family hydrolase, arginase/agmainase/formiminoglutamate hydrolase [Shewanella psychrophila]|uniref:Arginase family hydrolase, arginase/agmainase/formiminoglutamate hydrolase n=1 Tax=Shewanella psychrophila TaxID=225848 RepID=A0A1S6HRQ1_9GAMM|nr:formimidoylglutamase [Shewanella psychrophila]AQS38195.1 arginase family hydrolase, arginase/agmainase/formiminoglutamate hydrolase [Shewanella psychrophila]
MQYLIPFTRQVCRKLVSIRDGETKLAQTVHCSDGSSHLSETLDNAKASGVRFAILGIGEDIGPRANLGRGGATDAFESAMAQFLNLQSNRFLSGNECMVLGQIQTDDLQLGEEADADALRSNVELLDDRVITIASQVISAGLEPIVIGGGHNNAYGLLMSVKHCLNKKVAAVNLDPHSDFRPREGRHSGNGFSYAAASGALGYYHVLGMHELKNSEETLEQLSTFGGHWHTLQSIWIRREITLKSALDEIVTRLNDSQLPVALELDLDAIINMPSSASTTAGIPLLDALHYVSTIARNTPCTYLHLAEAAPSCHVAGIAAGYRETGQSISELIYAYIQGRMQAQQIG